MTRAMHRELLKEENGTIGDHLRNHLHLTNCIHLKNHIHRLSPIVAERSLMRDLIILQRSRSLRDPSASPPSWHSPSMVSSFARKVEKNGTLHSGRRSLGGTEQGKEGGRLSTSSLQMSNMATSKVAAAEVCGDNNSQDRFKVSGVSKAEDSGRKVRRSSLSGTNKKPPTGANPRNTDMRDKKILRRGTNGHCVHLKTLSERLAEATNQTDSEDQKTSHIHHHSTHGHLGNTFQEVDADGHFQCNGLIRSKRCRLKSVRRGQGPICSRDIELHNDLSVASNSLVQDSMHKKYYLREEEAGADLEAPRNVCGIPWNWSRIHHKGKTFLDLAGRSLSCGQNESRMNRTEALCPQVPTDSADMPVVSDHLSSSTRSDSEVLPLLLDSFGSHGSPDMAHEYSGELGIYASNNLNHDPDSEAASEARSGNHHSLNGCPHGRHRSLTQKYMPKTFRDLVGQNLVVQALSNAVARRKVGLIYVFYGPHGTGKTSCARVFARAMNCQALEHPKPCGTCNPCISLNMGKSRNIFEVGPIGNLDFEGIIGLLEKMMLPSSSSQYRVLILDDCDTLSHDSWNAISKVVDRSPRHVVFLLISTNLESLPHMIVSRCQKFFFPKLKDADIIYALQWIATKEGLEIDKDALKLIASKSDGSLRDAEMTLDQLGLLSQNISLTLVQELVGLVSDEKLVDLLDLALSADTVNTVKRLREIMEAGVEPLALMSQLATIITDILAGSYVFTRERLRKKFFRHQALSKEDMEKLRLALKTLSEAEKQLRFSNDKWTWLTAALLQLAPDQQYVLPSSSAETSFNHSPMLINNVSERDLPRKSTGGRGEVENGDMGLFRPTIAESSSRMANGGMQDGCKVKNMGGTRYASQASLMPSELTETTGRQSFSRRQKDIQKIWLAALEKIQVNSLKKLMLQEGKLISVSFGAAPTVQLMFSSPANTSTAEKFRGHILQAFESVLSSAITLEIRCESRKDVQSNNQDPRFLLSSENGSSQMKLKRETKPNIANTRMVSEKSMARISRDSAMQGLSSAQVGWMLSDSVDLTRNEITETANTPQGLAKVTDPNLQATDISALQNLSTSSSPHDRRGNSEASRRQSLVRSKVSLAHVIHQAEGHTQRSGWSRRKAISIAEKLEQENLRLEPRSRSLFCWKAPIITRKKVLRLKIRTRKSLSLLQRVPCGRCLQTRSPR